MSSELLRRIFRKLVKYSVKMILVIALIDIFFYVLFCGVLMKYYHVDVDTFITRNRLGNEYETYVFLTKNLLRQESNIDDVLVFVESQGIECSEIRDYDYDGRSHTTLQEALSPVFFDSVLGCSVPVTKGSFYLTSGGCGIMGCANVLFASPRCILTFVFYEGIFQDVNLDIDLTAI